MTEKDRDNYFSLMVFHDKLTTWKDSEDSEIDGKDRTKLKIITDMIIAMLVQYRKKEGETALNSILEESSKYKFAILKKDEELDLSGTFEPDILKNAIKEVTRDTMECSLCDRKDYKKCPWYTIHNFTGTAKCNCRKNDCPYKFIIEDL
ncbi:MAG: hypothetical protein RR342_01380 [Bacilli bacterium]|jgi:hypothetical protein